MPYAIKEDAADNLWKQLDISYFLRHAADEIAWHTRLLNYRVDTAAPIVKARLSPAGEGLQVMIYVRDREICSHASVVFRAHQLLDRRGENLYDAARLCAR